MRSLAISIHANFQPIVAFVGRNFSLLKRYWAWEASWLVYSSAIVMSIGFLAVGVGQVSGVDVPKDRVLVYLLTGSLIWRYLSELFWETSNVISWERWEGTIEYTFMAPISRVTHLAGMSAFAMLYAGVRLVALTGICVLMFDIDLSQANILGAVATLAIATVSLVGLGLVGASLPLMYPEKGSQMTGVVEAVLLMVSGIYYPVDVLPGWLQFFSQFSPITYALQGMRSALLEGSGFAELWPNIFPLLISGVLLIPFGLWVFGLAEVHCKKTGKLKRSG